MILLLEYLSFYYTWSKICTFIIFLAHYFLVFVPLLTKNWPLVELVHCKNGGKNRGKRHFMWSQFWDMSIYTHKVMSISKTCSNIMSFCKKQTHKSCFLCKTLWFRKTRLLKPFWDMSCLKTCLCVLREKFIFKVRNACLFACLLRFSFLFFPNSPWC